MPTISVVIPCYNQGHFVDEAVDSVLEQTFQDFEIIIVNDGSTDESTIAKLKNYSKPKTRVLHTTNQGLSAARNNGIKQARGNYIFPLDADDKIAPTYFAKAIKILEEKPEVGFVATYTRVFGRINVDNTYSQSGGAEKYVLTGNNSTCAALMRKKVFEEVGGYDESMKKGFEDWDFWIRVTSKGWKVHIIKEKLFFYRTTKGSMLTHSNQIRPELIKGLVEKNIEIFRKHIVDAIYHREQSIKTLRNRLYTLEKENESLKKKNFFQWIREKLRIRTRLKNLINK